MREKKNVPKSQKKSNHIKRFIKIAVSVFIIAGVIFLLQKLFVPKYADDTVEGSLVAEYYGDEKDHDVIFVGDCEVYENFSPVTLWKEYGINSYIRGSAQQYIWQSYYMLEDTLRYETPKAVIFNVQSLQYDEPQSEAYNRMTLEGMKWSPVKVKAINASMMPEEHFIEYVFPILRYHTRWNDLKESDFKYMFTRKKVSHNGYYMRTDVKSAQNVPEGRPLADYTFGDRAMSYLDKMRELCDKHGIRLILIKAPSLYPYWYDEYEKQVTDYAKKYGLSYINFLKIQDETGIDYDTDTYDAGLHMNLSGAEKLARYMGEYLRTEVGLSDRRGEKELSAAWEEKIADYEADIRKQSNKNR